ncbi:MAG TPA: TIR domain-containing protein [Sphingomicrobium sp.]|nr:TIR domain-containing protein [Sphingomicrobium sp.]
MNKLARLPATARARAASAKVLGRSRRRRKRSRYFAFLSYSHKDNELAGWLHSQLEAYRVPRRLAGQLTDNGVIPKRLRPIFRDEHELAAADDLGEEIETAIASSQFLIVLCSPAAAKSRWTNAEIDAFKRSRPDGCVFAAIASGEPFASEIPGREDEECFPPALRHKYDRRGRPTEKRAEPLAADLRVTGDGRRVGFLKLVAGMLGVGFDDLVQRETTRRQRRLAMLAAGSLAGMAVTSTLAITAIQARDAAREQRREAEGLIGFMLGDLKDKLEPLGRLDALDGVGAKVLAYYQKEGTADLSDAALSQRSRALSLMAEVATDRRDFDGALRLYREAMAGTKEAIDRKPDDPERLYQHAQNVFYLGYISHLQGDFKSAERYMREYKRLANQMVALGPDNMKWRMEVQYADVNLGTVFYDQRRFDEASEQFQEALDTMEAIARADPSNEDYKKNLAEALAWLGDVSEAKGELDAAIAARKRAVDILSNQLARTGDMDSRERLLAAQRSLGGFYDERGLSRAAIEQYRSAVAHAGTLAALEPGNSEWLEYGYSARFDLATRLLNSNELPEAITQVDDGCATVRTLLKRDGANLFWRAGLASCLFLKSQIAIRNNSPAQAREFARQSVEIARRSRKGDAVSTAHLVAKAWFYLGEAEHAAGNKEAARRAWNEGLAAIPRAFERPDEMQTHLELLNRLGRNAEAKPLQAKLKAMGYQET